ncbi:MAG: alpha/beta hydrolase [Pseudonocardiaceae bacterium]|nr:alpha/beta hydrolase [Pseudonocardiaceae bacterium]
MLLPGTGSDEVFVRSVFEQPLRAVGISLHTPAPSPGTGLADEYLRSLDRHAAHQPVLAGGISLGAHLAVEWALRNPAHCAGLLLALPAWNGRPDGAPAALAARLSAGRVADDGLDAALRASTEGLPGWLADELNRAWRRYGAGLADSLRTAAARPVPRLAELRRIHVPVGVAGFVDDPVHPVAVASSWAGELPRGRLCTTSLAAMRHDPRTLGRAAILAWLRALAG